jgi:hypothetical protein
MSLMLKETSPYIQAYKPTFTGTKLGQCIFCSLYSWIENGRQMALDQMV